MANAEDEFWRAHYEAVAEAHKAEVLHIHHQPHECGVYCPQDEMAIACANCPHIKGRHYRGGKPYCVPDSGECECPGFATRVVRFPAYSKAEAKKPVLHEWDIKCNSAYCVGAPQCDEQCDTCGHWKNEHNAEDGQGCSGIAGHDIGTNGYERCHCFDFTKAEQSQSYSQSVQSEPQPQYEERPASFHSQCKFQHGRIVGDQLARTENTLRLGPPEELAKDWEQLCQLLLAQSRCEEAECQAVRRLAVQALSNLRLELVSFHRTRREFPKPSSQ